MGFYGSAEPQPAKKRVLGLVGEVGTMVIMVVSMAGALLVPLRTTHGPPSVLAMKGHGFPIGASTTHPQSRPEWLLVALASPKVPSKALGSEGVFLRAPL